MMYQIQSYNTPHIVIILSQTIGTCTLYTDTDSFMMEVQTEDIYEDIKAKEDLYDTSDYPKEHFLYSAKNKKVLGKMKDECAGKHVIEFVALRPKMYSELTASYALRKAKGVKKYVVKRDLTHDLYLKVLNAKKIERHRMNAFRSYGHQIYNITTEKVSLSPFDSKRYMLEDGIHTLAFGHYGITNNSSRTNPRLGPSFK